MQHTFLSGGFVVCGDSARVRVGVGVCVGVRAFVCAVKAFFLSFEISNSGLRLASESDARKRVDQLRLLFAEYLHDDAPRQLPDPTRVIERL